MGWFDTFESDYGSAFKNELFQRINKTLGIKQNFSKPQNHQETRKVSDNQNDTTNNQPM